jgi:hypothetical protein
MDKNEPKKPDKPNLFKPGMVANPNGRPKGSPNKINARVKNLIEKFYFDNEETMQADFDSLDAKDRWAVRLRMLPFITPTMMASKEEKTINHTGFEHMSTKQLRDILLKFNPSKDAEDIDHTETE